MDIQHAGPREFRLWRSGMKRGIGENYEGGGKGNGWSGTKWVVHLNLVLVGLGGIGLLGGRGDLMVKGGK